MKKIKILLIDDDPWIRNSLMMYFQEEGCSLVALETAEEGLEEISRNNYDVVISDYRLPGMNGLKFLQKVQVAQPDTPIILLTAFKDRNIISEAQQIRVHDLIYKPISAKNLETSISTSLYKKSQRKSKKVAMKR
jgi:DNA-binding NtrC family response regulator